jgi:high-affinity nickel-transport protein
MSAVFLWITAAMNIVVLMDRKSAHAHFSPKGFLFSLCKPIFNTINKPWKMYFVGFLFGLGFDTATEVGLLSISASSVLQGFHASVILLLPILFSIGMVFTDSCDALFMSAVYRSTSVRAHQLQFYYQLIMVVATVLAILIGLSEVIAISSMQFNTHLFKLINNHFEWIGASIVILFSIIFLYAKRKSFT